MLLTAGLSPVAHEFESALVPGASGSELYPVVPECPRTTIELGYLLDNGAALVEEDCVADDSPEGEATVLDPGDAEHEVAATATNVKAARRRASRALLRSTAVVPIADAPVTWITSRSPRVLASMRLRNTTRQRVRFSRLWGMSAVDVRRPGASGDLSPRVSAYVALKYFASGWCTISAEVDCSGCSWNSSESSTPMR
jgi:hypothetical protein